MATCPNCSVSSRQDPGALNIDVVRETNEISPTSDFFVQATFVMKELLRLTCERCGWSVLGYIDGDHFVADPSTQVYPYH